MTLVEKYVGGPTLPLLVQHGIIREVGGPRYCVETWDCVWSPEAPRAGIAPRRGLCETLAAARAIMAELGFSAGDLDVSYDKQIDWLTQQPLPEPLGKDLSRMR